MKYVSTFLKYLYMYKLRTDFTILRKVTKVSSSLSAAQSNTKKTIKISYFKDEDCETRMKENAVIIVTSIRFYHVPSFQKLLKMSQQQSRSAYKQAQHDLIDYLDREVFFVHLIEPSRVTAHEIFCYSDGNQAKHHIRGSLRAAIHMGLNDPQMYLDVSGQVPHEWLAHAISLVQAPRVIAHVGNVPEKFFTANL